ncbi:MAG: hypothetical protein K6G15_11185 [Desulfovibrio sp.]|nr:hypothetical protein [Desulfovibrio sp.]
MTNVRGFLMPPMDRSLFAVALYGVVFPVALRTTTLGLRRKQRMHLPMLQQRR